jgi:histidyl-tRNA synthetase
MSKTNPARGMRDFLPADVRKRDYVIGIIKQVYESYGYEPLETPAVENIETLMGKYGEEGNQLIYRILKRREKLRKALNVPASDLVVWNPPAAIRQNPEGPLADLALRYDLTVPLSRVVADRGNELPKFFKRYQIQPVWRADRPARGRFREFYQCDVDAIGSESMIVEVELIQSVTQILKRLGFNDFTIRLNHRDILTGLLNTVGLEENKHADALIALDKLDKLGFEGVSEELRSRRIGQASSEKLLLFFELFFSESWKNRFNKPQVKKVLKSTELVDEIGAAISDRTAKTKANIEKIQSIYLPKEIPPLIKKEIKEKLEIKSNDIESKSLWDVLQENVSDDIKQTFRNYDNLVAVTTIADFLEGDNGLIGTTDLLRIINRLDAAATWAPIIVDPTLARGLSYYTGTIMEINVPDLAGSLGGGGRYDGLIGMFGKEQIPACGFSLGLERILVVMDERGMFPPEIADSTPADVMVTLWSEETAAESLKLASELRGQGLRVTVYPEADKFGKQMKYADSIRVPFVCVLGESEIAEGKVTVKNMKTGKQQTVERDLAADLLRNK